MDARAADLLGIDMTRARPGDVVVALNFYMVNKATKHLGMELFSSF